MEVREIFLSKNKIPESQYMILKKGWQFLKCQTKGSIPPSSHDCIDTYDFLFVFKQKC